MTQPIHNTEITLKGGSRVELWFDEREETQTWFVYRLRGMMVARIRKADVEAVKILFEQVGKTETN